jgi:catechol 2,3-dioxygenase-like lactoylglutathione lyase family enzyme
MALRVRDIAKSRAFYLRAPEPFGVRVVQSSQGPGYATDDRGDFWIQEQETAAGPVHIALPPGWTGSSARREGGQWIHAFT